jgi:ATP-binding cassette subfamily C protein CydD
VAWLPQRAHLFYGTIAENLRIAGEHASPEKLRQAARQAVLDEFICSLPGGYETRVGEGGVGLSGGQAQRLALARAFLAAAPLLVVDEPTAWLDGDLELALTASLRQLSTGHTVLLIAHRMETVQRADWVVVLEAGRVVEQGTPVALKAQGGAFARLSSAGDDLP